jgi:chromosome segregation ATPase
MSTKGYPAPLTWDRLLELAAQGHDHYDAALTSTRARQLVASVREHFEDAEQWGRACYKNHADATLALSSATETLEQVRAEVDTANARIAELARSVLTSDAGRDSAFDLIVEAHNERDAAFNALEAANARADAAERKLASSESKYKTLNEECARRVGELEFRIKGLEK